MRRGAPAPSSGVNAPSRGGAQFAGGEAARKSREGVDAGVSAEEQMLQALAQDATIQRAVLRELARRGVTPEDMLNSDNGEFDDLEMLRAKAQGARQAATLRLSRDNSRGM